MEVNDSEDTTVAFPGYTLRPLQQPQPPQMHLPPTQHQLLVAQHSTPPRQYTTVGSVYNPQPHPRQPPVRRGRTIKSLYPYKSESPAGPSQVQYTPLQQNSDRAVSPARLYSRSPPSTLTVTNQTRRVLQKFGVAIPTVHAAGELPGRARHADDEVANSIEVLANPTVEDGSTMFANMRAESEDESDGANTKPISAMNFNSLTNLASYPNPMQRAAQKVLASHRPLPTPAIGSHVSEDQSFHCDGETDPLVPLVEDSGFMSALPRVRGAPAPFRRKRSFLMCDAYAKYLGTCSRALFHVSRSRAWPGSWGPFSTRMKQPQNNSFSRNFGAFRLLGKKGAARCMLHSVLSAALPSLQTPKHPNLDDTVAPKIRSK
ncbi:hypothetical protein NUW58_g4737 [Xylaria curta]|uniref:Uncharacterized protein n=1 Tax=Xylaria curta TaxID=42375 RepID=A0ACC1P7T3_9PEZI|nr:hypothetical protein NUW58_g4737 [Xylaria curta]